MPDQTDVFYPQASIINHHISDWTVSRVWAACYPAPHLTVFNPHVRWGFCLVDQHRQQRQQQQLKADPLLLLWWSTDRLLWFCFCSLNNCGSSRQAAAAVFWLWCFCFFEPFFTPPSSSSPSSLPQPQEPGCSIKFFLHYLWMMPSCGAVKCKDDGWGDVIGVKAPSHHSGDVMFVSSDAEIVWLQQEALSLQFQCLSQTISNQFTVTVSECVQVALRLTGHYTTLAWDWAEKGKYMSN